MERQVQIQKNSIRKELESYVVSTNICLKDAVTNMDLIILLRNGHPIYAPNFATKLYDEGMLTKDEIKEFTKPIGSKFL